MHAILRSTRLAGGLSARNLQRPAAAIRSASASAASVPVAWPRLFHSPGSQPSSSSLSSSTYRIRRHFTSNGVVYSSATPSSTPSQPPTSSSSSAPSSASSDSASASVPRTTADEKTDAEAGLNEKINVAGTKQQTPQTSGNGSGSGGSGTAPKAERSSPISWRSVVLLVVVGGATVIFLRFQHEKRMNTVRVETIGTPMLGGPFSLIDDEGRRVTSESLKGEYVLLYFGFTHCPDICPSELKKMEQALNQFESSHPNTRIIPLFISIDPRRDTPQRLRTYKKDFDPRMRWLTGSEDEIKTVARSYRVYYSAPDVPEGSADDYLVDHSIFFYLLDREGQFMEFFGKSRSADEVAARMSQLIEADNRAK